MFIKKIPDTPEIINCPKHGEFEVRYQRLISRIMENRSCSKCVIEKDERLQLEEKQKHEAQVIEKLATRRANAGISKRNINKTFNDFICDTEKQKRAKQVGLDFINNFPSEQNILMLGSVGTGKTLLASIIVDQLLPRYQCKIVKVMDIIRAIKGTWGGNSELTESGIIERLINLDLLVIDEVGSQFGSDTERLFIFDIIDGRYQEMKQTILISNLDAAGVKEVVGERCLDRLREGGGKMIAFDWDSKRA